MHSPLHQQLMHEVYAIITLASEGDCTELHERMHVLGGRLYGMMRR